MESPFTEVTTYQYSTSGFHQRPENLIFEQPVDISVNGKKWQTLICTPVDQECFAIGLAFNEGLVDSYQEIKLVDVCQNGRNVDLWLNHTVRLPRSWTKTSGCTGGMTTKRRTHIAYQKHPPTALSPSAITSAMDSLQKSQKIYTSTGGIHSSALHDGKDLVVAMEDIGRHNTLDKVAGYCLKGPGFPRVGIILSTGRVSSEMVQKSFRMGASFIVSKTGTSSLAVEMAQEMGICLIGYCRRDRFVAYTHVAYLELVS